MSAPATSADEAPTFFRAGSHELFGILTRPTVDPRGSALIMLAGGCYVPAMHRNRLSVRITRRAAALGYHAFRMDYHGVGESTGFVETWRLGDLFVDDLEGGLAWIRQQGISRFVLAGSCFGARTCLATAARVRELEAVILLVPPVRDFEMGMREVEAAPPSSDLKRAFSKEKLRGLLDARTRSRYRRRGWALLAAAARRAARRLGIGPRDEFASRVSRKFLDSLDALVERRIPVLIVYGDQDSDYREFRRAQAGRLGKILERAAGRVEVRVAPGQVHGFTTLGAQETTLEIIEEWLAREH
ncbi:MAG: alpha/beta fold hydrolase [Actinomycetota bacterium]